MNEPVPGPIWGIDDRGRTIHLPSYRLGAESVR